MVVNPIRAQGLVQPVEPEEGGVCSRRSCRRDDTRLRPAAARTTRTPSSSACRTWAAPARDRASDLRGLQLRHAAEHLCPADQSGNPLRPRHDELSAAEIEVAPVQRDQLAAPESIW